jgi:hypothetical protein
LFSILNFIYLKDPARIIEYTSVIFNYEHESVYLNCRTIPIKERIHNRKFKKSMPLNGRMNQIQHIWLDNHNKQIKDTDNGYQLFANGDLLIRNLTFSNHFGQFACVTRNGNKIDSISAFIFPVS